MNPDFKLTNIPERTAKPRESGITMVMDKGLSTRQAEDFLEVSADKTDIIKLGFGTSSVTPTLTKKLALYKEAGIPVYFGGTLFEAFVIRGQFDDYKRLLDKFGITHAEVSDGSMEISEEEKCGYIRSLAKDFTVLS
ncbi:MAG: phosphosulfolactate synthase, partial [Bacteroidetes bacterium]|nr:phosphosulfolactate synthase [Bacteroidota bacterium]